MASTRWTWITGLAVLFAGITNAHAHVHYCFDGQEPPAAVHLSDGIDHAHEHPGPASHHDDVLHHDDADHDDLDLDLPNEALAKIVKHDQLALAPLLGWSTVIDSRPAAALAWSSAAPPAPDPLYARPPLRGPPR
jgi:hypothetical protein